MARRHLVPDVVREPQAIALPPDAPARQAARLMNERGVSSVLVMDQGRLLGIVTVRDIARRIVGEGRDADATTMAEIMTASPKCCACDESPQYALRLMHEGGFRHLPIEKDGRIVGVVVRSDFNPEEEEYLRFERSLWEHMR